MARFNMNIPDFELHDLEELADELGITTTNLIRTFCKLGMVLTNRQRRGDKIIVRGQNSVEVELLFL